MSVKEKLKFNEEFNRLLLHDFTYEIILSSLWRNKKALTLMRKWLFFTGQVDAPYLVSAVT